MQRLVQKEVIYGERGKEEGGKIVLTAAEDILHAQAGIAVL